MPGKQQLLTMNATAKRIRTSCFFATLTVFLCITGCQPPVNPEEEETTPSASASAAPGFGTSRAQPQGQPFVWPTGVTVLGKPKLEYECLVDAVNKKQIYGSGGAVRFCLTLHNANHQPVTVILPPGIIWIAETVTETQAVQNGILIKSVRILIPASSQLSVMLNAFCINLDRSPTDYGDTYNPQPVITSQAGMLELSRLVASKKINDEELEKPMPTDDWVTLQEAVHEVEKTGKVSEESRRKLTALPE